jgi:hypothetical protein
MKPGRLRSFTPAIVLFAVALAGGIALGELRYFTNMDGFIQAELSYGPTTREEVVVNGIRLECLAPTFSKTLFEELKSQDFDDLVTLQTKNPQQRVPKYEILLCESSDGLEVEFLTRSSRASNAVARFCWRASFYVNAKADGHTDKYIRAALQESETTNFSLPPAFPLELKQMRSIPSQWIKQYYAGNLEDESPSNILASLARPVPPQWLVIDGPYAWIYEGTGWYKRRDAQEYDPQLKPQFQAALKEARDSLANRGVARSIDSRMVLNREIQRILLTRFKTHWRTPEELNWVQ